MSQFGRKMSIITYVPKDVLERLDFERGDSSLSSYVSGILEDYCKISSELND